MMHSYNTLEVFKDGSETGLNPCFNGWCTRTQSYLATPEEMYGVLILVLMDDALVHITVIPASTITVVLILVLMDDALVLH